MNNFNLSDDKMNQLLQLAGQKLGQNPDDLRQQLESGSLDNITRNMDPKAAGKLNTLLQNPKALETVLQNDKVKNMLNGLLGNQK